MRAVRWVLGRLAALGDFAVPEWVSPELELPVHLPCRFFRGRVNGQLGQIISDYLPRQAQLVLKLYF